MPARDPMQREIVQLIRARFAFLKTEKGFTKPVIHTSLDHLIFRNTWLKLKVETDFLMNGTMNIALEQLAPPEQPTRSSWNLLGLLYRRLHIQDERITQLQQMFGDRYRARGAFPRVDLAQDSAFIIAQTDLYRGLLLDYIDLILKQPVEILFPTDLEYLPMLDARTAIENYATEQLAFLSQHGFSPAPIRESNSIQTYLSWLNQRLGVRMSLDYRDANVSLGLLLLKADEPIIRKDAKKYHLDLLNIERQLWSWEAIAKLLHLPITYPMLPQFYFWSSECDYAFATRYIDMYHAALVGVIDDIIDGKALWGR